MRLLPLVVVLGGCLGTPARPAPDASMLPADIPFGDNTIEEGWDSHACGTPEAASFKMTGTVAEIRSLWIYIAGADGDDATRLDAAIYDSDGAGNPTTRVVAGFVEMATPLPQNQWHQLPLAQPYTPVFGHVYWIAAMCPVGKGTQFTMVYKYLGDGGGGDCDANVTSCTQHGRSDEGTLDSVWQMTATYLPSTNSYYASTQ